MKCESMSVLMEQSNLCPSFMYLQIIEVVKRVNVSNPVLTFKII